MKPICELGLFSLSRSFRNCTLNHWRLRWFYKYNTYDTYYIIYAYIYIYMPYLLPQLPIFLALNSQLQDRRIYIYIYMYTQCLYVSMQEVVIDISPKGSKIKNGLCKKNIVKSFPTFLGSRKSRLPLFRVSCFWRLQNQKKHVDINYISLGVLFPWIYGVSPSFCVRLLISRFGWVFLGGRSHKKQQQRKVTGIPKSFSWSPWAKNSSKQTKAQALV